MPKNSEEIKTKHMNAFNWRADRVPLGIWVYDKRKYKEININSPDFHKLLFERQMTVVQDTMELGSDIVPVLGITNYGVAIVPSIFGAALKSSSSDVDRVEEMGYWVEKIFDKIDNFNNFAPPEIKSDFLDDVIEHFEYYKSNAPAWVAISNSLDGPFSIAELLRGPSLYTDLYDRPEYVHQLLDIVTDVIIRCEKFLRSLLGCSETVGAFPTYFGMWFHGLRLGDDSLVNLSENMIREFIVPYYKKISKSFNCPIEIHFCTTDKLIGEPILRAFEDCDEVPGISTQLGVLFYLNNMETIQDRLSIEAGYGDGIDYHARECGGFKTWASELKSRFRKPSGLVLYTSVESMDEGEKMIDEWHEVWSG